MATAPLPTTAAPKIVEHAPSRLKPAWQKFGTPVIIVLLAIAVIVTITRNWNAWEGGHVEQVTNDAYVRGDLTPLSTKVPGLVREVKVNDYQQVRKGDLLVQLDHEAKERGVTKSWLIRESLERALRKRGARGKPSCFDLSSDLAGSVKDLPKDLAENPRYLEGLGE